MSYVEGFLIAVPTANKQAYIERAMKTAALLKEFGLTRVVETWGDDVPHGKLNDLYMAVQAKDDETVLFSWFEYPDKAARQAASDKMMSDPRMKEMVSDLPFDGSRLIWSGFEVVNDAGQGGKMGYVDGVVVPAVTAGKATYVAFCKTIADAFVEQGASRVVDAWGDDMLDGKKTDFKRATQLKNDETVTYGWIEWPSKQVRDAAWPKLMNDERLSGAMDKRGVDGKRMMFGGFTPLLDL